MNKELKMLNNTIIYKKYFKIQLKESIKMTNNKKIFLSMGITLIIPLLAGCQAQEDKSLNYISEQNKTSQILYLSQDDIKNKIDEISKELNLIGNEKFNEETITLNKILNKDNKEILDKISELETNIVLLTEMQEPYFAD